MKLVNLGATQIKVSEMCLGTMIFADRCDYQVSEEIVHAAIDQGINFIDTAAMYSQGACEEYLGKILKGKRNKVFLATKVLKGLDKKSIMDSLNESLARLQTDYIDLYMIHWPAKGMNVTEVMQALNETVASGKARFVGCSNYPAWLLAHSNAIAERNGWAKLICNSVAYNLIERGAEIEILPQAVADNIIVTPHRVLAIGLLSGKYNTSSPIPINTRGTTDSRAITWFSQYGASIDRFNHFATEKGVLPANLAIAWVRYSKAVTCPIIGVSSVRQLQETFNAFEFDLTLEEYTQVTDLFNSEIKEEGYQLFPGFKYNFPRLRRRLDLLD